MSNFKTKLMFRPDAPIKILKGVDTLYNAVSTTLGPRGQNVAIARPNPYGEVYARDIIHDGVKVAKSVDLEDEFENMGAQVLKEAAQKTVDEVGDGTTLTVVLARSIITECMQIISTGVNPMALRKGLEDGVGTLLKELEQHATAIKTLKEETSIATISAEDPDLGQLVAATLHKMGAEGVVTVEESKDSDTRVDHQEGMQLENGYLHPLFMTNPDKMEVVLEEPYILVTDKEINALVDMGDLLTALHDRGARLVIISPSIGGDALPLLIQNKLSGQLINLAIKAPSFGEIQKNILQDIAALTKATFITEDAGFQLADIELKHLGHAQYISATKSTSMIVGGKGLKKDIEARKAMIKTVLKNEEREFEQIKLKERLGKLTNGVTVIYVGGYTEIEMKERKERVEDAVHATRAAMRKGIVPGGEIIFLRARKVLGDSLAEKILYRALEAPFNKLVSNAGFDPGETREQLKLQQFTNSHMGFDVTDGKFKDFIVEGIIDPALVTMKALENAVSVAILLMTTGALIVPNGKILPKKQ